MKKARSADTLMVYLENDLFASGNNDRYHTHDFGTYLIRPVSDSSAPVDDSDPRF